MMVTSWVGPALGHWIEALVGTVGLGGLALWCVCRAVWRTGDSGMPAVPSAVSESRLFWAMCVSRRPVPDRAGFVVLNDSMYGPNGGVAVYPGGVVRMCRCLRGGRPPLTLDGGAPVPVSLRACGTRTTSRRGGGAWGPARGPARCWVLDEGVLEPIGCDNCAVTAAL